MTFWPTWLRRDRLTRFTDQLLGSLVQADYGARGIMRPLIDLQYVFHGGHEGRAGVRCDDPLVFQVRLEDIFFSVRPIVLSLTRSTMFNSTTLSSSIRSVHRTRPAGACEQASAISLASAAPSKTRFLAEAGECLRVNTASKPSSTSCRRVRAMVARLVSSALDIWLSLHASPPSEASAFNRMRAFISRCAGCFPQRIMVVRRSRSSPSRFTTYFFTAISLVPTNGSGSVLPGHRFAKSTHCQ